jgi:hypothetical protein
MIRKPNTPYPGRPGQRTSAGARRPFWLPASNYYVLAVAVSGAFFFLIWGILHDEGDETPWITAGVSASILLAGAVVLREVILRRARIKQYQMERKIGANFASVGRRIGDNRPRAKLTLQQNAAILADIKQKSNAATVLNKFSAGHREVFELCSEYVGRNEEELRSVNAGSPRFSALLKGRNAATGIHRYHLLQWAEIEARQLINEANTRADATERVKAANEAMSVIEYALESYPTESSLLESRKVLIELILSIKISVIIEHAERAAFSRDYREAIGHYRDALFYLGRDNLNTGERQQAADRINAEIERLRSLERGI